MTMLMSCLISQLDVELGEIQNVESYWIKLDFFCLNFRGIKKLFSDKNLAKNLSHIFLQF